MLSFLGNFFHDFFFYKTYSDMMLYTVSGLLLFYPLLILQLSQQFIHKLVRSSKGTVIRTIQKLKLNDLFRSNEIVWIATSYMLSYTALQPLCK